MGVGGRLGARQRVPGQLIPNAASPSGIRALMLGAYHTKALHTPLLCWAHPLAAPPPSPQPQQRGEHQNPPEKSYWTQQGKEEEGAAKRGRGGLTPLRMWASGLSTQPHKGRGLMETLQSGPQGEHKPGQSRH